MTLLRPADIESTLRGLLVDAHTVIPNPRPSNGFTVVSRAGGAPINLVQSQARVIVESWDKTRTAAFERNVAAWVAINALNRTVVDGIWIADVELTEPTKNPDPATTTPRYQFVAQITTSLVDA